MGVRLTFEIATGVGKALPTESCTTVGAVISVAVNMAGLPVLVNSVTAPVTCTLLPTTAAAGGADEEVKTRMPSDVAGSPSTPASGVCRKKPFEPVHPIQFTAFEFQINDIPVAVPKVPDRRTSTGRYNV